MKKWTLAERAQAIYIRRRDLGVLSDLAYCNGNTRRPSREPSASCPKEKCIQNSGRLRAAFRFLKSDGFPLQQYGLAKHGLMAKGTARDEREPCGPPIRGEADAPPIKGALAA